MHNPQVLAIRLDKIHNAMVDTVSKTGRYGRAVTGIVDAIGDFAREMQKQQADMVPRDLIEEHFGKLGPQVFLLLKEARPFNESRLELARLCEDTKAIRDMLAEDSGGANLN